MRSGVEATRQLFRGWGPISKRGSNRHKLSLLWRSRFSGTAGCFWHSDMETHHHAITVKDLALNDRPWYSVKRNLITSC